MICLIVKENKKDKKDGVTSVTLEQGKIVKVDTDKNVILVKGSVPGNKYSVLKIRNSVKSAK